MGHRKSRAASRRPVRAWLTIAICVGISLWLALHMPARAETPVCRLELKVLGVAQDAGIPQIGYPEDPARYPDSLETAEVERRGFAIAREGEGMCLSRDGDG